jgi:mannose-6-phosphate isomerase-like protein (cupin superfamily)
MSDRRHPVHPTQSDDPHAIQVSGPDADAGVPPPDAGVPPPLEARLLEALQPPSDAALPAMDAATIRERLHRRIRETRSVTTIAPDEGDWLPFSPKVHIKVLRRDVETQSYLLRLAPGAVLLPHVHGHDEECMVLEGEVRIGDLVVRQGAYHLAPKGVPHEPIRSEGGALLFLRGAIPSASQVRWARAAIHALTGR